MVLFESRAGLSFEGNVFDVRYEVASNDASKDESLFQDTIESHIAVRFAL
jgi:hypothetical protein